MSDFLQKLFDTDDFPARWHCGNWDTFHGWLHIGADIAIWAAYMAIPAALIYFCGKRRDILFARIVLLFAAFILTCGTVHLIDAVIFYNPVYRFSGLMKALTAGVSWAAAIAVWRVLPAAIELPGLRTVNADLQRELTRRREVESELTKSHQELKLITSMVAHDLRNPMSSAVLMSEMIHDRLKAGSDPNMLKSAATLTESLRQMTSFIVTLEKHSSLDQAAETLHDVDVGELLSEVKSTLAPVISVAEGKMTWDPMPIVRGDRDRLLHLLLNLIENSFKYGTGTNPAVHVSSSMSGMSTEIRICDNGPGIPPDQVEQVFEEGYRGEHHRPTEGKGRGLAFCRRIMNDLGGTISIDPLVTSGTCIVLRFRPRLPGGREHLRN